MTTSIPPSGGQVERMWQQALAPGPSCLAIERLVGTLTEAEEAHVAGCARCQTERDLFAAYETSEPAEGEGLAVAWIAAQTKRRLAAAQPGAAGPAAVPSPATSPRTRWGVPTWALIAAAVAVIVTGSVLLMNPSRRIDAVPGGGDVYRSARVETTSPTGELAEAPAAFVWTVVAGAAEYEVRLSEVDGTELWRVATSSPSVSVPAEIRARALPAKTLMWQVRAKDPQGRTIGESGATAFRVRIPPSSPGK